MNKILVGQSIPEFTAMATSGVTFNSSKLDNKNIVLYFYPKDNTPGCTTESIDFRDAYPEFIKCNTQIFGVSKDSLESHEKFRKQYSLPFELISDKNVVLCKLFDVIKLKQMYGKEFLGIERSTFLVDKHGVLQNEWRKVRLKNHIEDVLQAAKAIDKYSSNKQ